MVAGVRGVGAITSIVAEDRTRVQHKHVLHVQRRFFFMQIEVDAVFWDLGGLYDIARAASPYMAVIRAVRTSRSRTSTLERHTEWPKSIAHLWFKCRQKSYGPLGQRYARAAAFVAYRLAA